MRGLLFITIFSFLFAACTYNTNKKSQGAPSNAQLATETLVSADLVMRMSLRACKNCHSEFADANGIRAALGDVLDAVESNFMPDTSKGDSLLTNCEKSILRAWANLGGPNETTILIQDLPECAVQIQTQRTQRPHH